MPADERDWLHRFLSDYGDAGSKAELAARKPLTVNQIKAELAKVQAAQATNIQNYASSTNPQVVLLRNRAQSLHDFIEALQNAINGSSVELKTYQ